MTTKLLVVGLNNNIYLIHLIRQEYFIQKLKLQWVLNSQSKDRNPNHNHYAAETKYKCETLKHLCVSLGKSQNISLNLLKIALGPI